MCNSIINLASFLQSSKSFLSPFCFLRDLLFNFFILRNMETTVWSKARLIKTVWRGFKAILSYFGSFGYVCAFVSGPLMGSCDSSPQSGKHQWIVGNCWYHFETWRKRDREEKCSCGLQWFQSSNMINLTKLVCHWFCFLCKALKFLNKRWEEKIVARRI